VRLIVVDKTALGALSPSDSSNGTAMQLIEEGEEIGRAVVNYSSVEISRIKGKRSSDIMSILGYADGEYVAFRENVSLVEREKSRPETPTLGMGRRTPTGHRTPTKEKTPESSIADLRLGR
jgi:glutamate 5-kinase